MEKITIKDGTLYLPPALTGKKLRRFLDINGLSFISPRQVVRLRSNLPERLQRSITEQALNIHFNATRTKNEIMYKIVDR